MLHAAASTMPAGPPAKPIMEAVNQPVLAITRFLKLCKTNQAVLRANPRHEDLSH
jgi:hypothetical protein